MDVAITIKSVEEAERPSRHPKLVLHTVESTPHPKSPSSRQEVGYGSQCHTKVTVELCRKRRTKRRSETSDGRAEAVTVGAETTETDARTARR